ATTSRRCSSSFSFLLVSITTGKGTPGRRRVIMSSWYSPSGPSVVPPRYHMCLYSTKSSLSALVCCRSIQRLTYVPSGAGWAACGIVAQLSTHHLCIPSPAHDVLAGQNKLAPSRQPASSFLRCRWVMSLLLRVDGGRWTVDGGRKRSSLVTVHCP